MAATSALNARPELLDARLAEVFRESAPRLTAALTRAIGDFELAEESVQDAILAALEAWPAKGVPDEPAAWLHTVARNRALDRIRRDRRYSDKLAEIPALEPARDDRLMLMFTCCHPALAQDAQLALILQAVCGFTTEQISHALLTSEPAIAQRVSRARKKIV